MRKTVVIDQRKLDAVRRAFNVTTDKEAIDQALDSIAFSREVVEGIRAIRLAGGINEFFVDDVSKGR